MTFVKINGVEYPATIAGRMMDRDFDNRESKAITLTMDYDTALALFANDVAWSIVYEGEVPDEETGETKIVREEYDNSDFCVAGDITDHRDGTITVKMGKITDAEALAIITGEVSA